MNSETRDLLPFYWGRLFPFQAFQEWLDYGRENLFERREFVLNFGDVGDRFLRNLSFKNHQDLKTYIKNTKPNKIDIGAVYSVSPQPGKCLGKPVQKELVLDIDLTDYDDIRVCCSGAKTCTKCWKYVVLAIKILDSAIREDFGFEHILWVYSGRRGVHAWICDKKARNLRPGGRHTFINYLQLIIGSDNVAKKVHLPDRIHVSVRRALQFIDQVFVQLAVIDQDMLGTDRNVDKFLRLLHAPLRCFIKEYLMKFSTSLMRWTAFVELFNRNMEEPFIEDWIKKPHLIEEIKIQYAYPRMDLQVTHSTSHLLKSPFSIHPKTGIVGVPIDHENVEKFDPFSLPTLSQLLDQIDLYHKKSKEKGFDKTSVVQCVHDLEKTTLESNHSLFHRFIHNMKTDLI